MKNIAIILFFGVSILFFTGCVSKNKMYYFEDYSETLYDYTKNPCEDTLSKHYQELEKIVAESDKHGAIVPPGIYAEIGYLNLKSNKIKAAIAYFEKEKIIYPESKILMERLIQKAKLTQRDETLEPKG